MCLKPAKKGNLFGTQKKSKPVISVQPTIDSKNIGCLVDLLLWKKTRGTRVKCVRLPYRASGMICRRGFPMKSSQCLACSIRRDEIPCSFNAASPKVLMLRPRKLMLRPRRSASPKVLVLVGNDRQHLLFFFVPGASALTSFLQVSSIYK